jgi:hypothetical protein
VVNRRRPMSAPNILDIDVELPGVRRAVKLRCACEWGG